MKLIIGSEGKGIWGQKVIRQLIKKIYKEIDIEFINDSSCDLIIKSVFIHNEKIWNTDFKKYIYWSGESYMPDESEYQTKKLYISTTINNIDTNNNIYLPYVLFSSHLYKGRLFVNNERKYLLAYCNSHKVKEREDFYNLFIEKTSDTLCHAYGKCCGKYKNTQQPRAEGNWCDINLINIYKDYKFVIAMENKCLDGYVTEKIVNAFYSGAIPIYWGSSNINDFFNKNAFINVNDYDSFDDCINYILTMDELSIIQMQSEPIYNTENEIINLLNNDYNLKNENKTLKSYLEKLNLFLTD